MAGLDILGDGLSDWLFERRVFGVMSEVFDRSVVMFRPEWRARYEAGVRATALREGGMKEGLGRIADRLNDRLEGWTFEDGAVVELRSSSAPMTVHASLRGRDGAEYVQVCYWHGEEACEVYDLKAVVELKRIVVG